MRSRAFWLTAALLSGFLAGAPVYAEVGENLLSNGGFESGGIAPYGVYDDDAVNPATTEVVTNCVGAAVPQGPAEGMYCLHIVVPPRAPGENDWDVGMVDNSHIFKNGKRYIFSCFMKCKAGTLQVRLKPEHAAEPWEAYTERVVTITDTWKKYSVTTPIMTERVTPASPTFHFNFAAGDFWIDDVRLYEVQDEGATYTWTGAAGDFLWVTPGNWEVVGSIYTWPNEEFGLPRVNQDCGEITIGNGDMVAHPKDLMIRSGAHGSGEAVLVIENGSALSKLTMMSIGRNASRGRVVVRNGGLLGVGGELRLAQDDGSAGSLSIVDGTVKVGGVLQVGYSGLGATGEVEIKGGVLSVGGVNLCRSGASGVMVVKDGATVAINAELRMNSTAAGLASRLVMDGGTVNAARTYVNYAGGVDSRADFTLNDGTWDSGIGLHAGNTTNGGNAYLTINGGTMYTSGWIWVGSGSSGQTRIYLNGGLLQGEGLAIKAITDSHIVFRGGELRIKSSVLGEADMQALITAGQIDVPADYQITTIDGYTVLR